MDITDKVILITGSTDGIGRQTALELAGMGETILIHGRDRRRVEKTVRMVRDETGNNRIDSFVADLSSLRQVRELAREVKNRFESLDVLINNAGVYQGKLRHSEDGYEMTFAVNHLAHFLLTLLLLELLRKKERARIVNVASMAHASSIDFDNLQGEKGFDPYGAYSLSKLANIMFTYSLAERLEGEGVTANCLHPGVIDTKLLRAGFGGGSPVSTGARTSVYCATAPELKGVSGKYFRDSREAKTSAVSYDKDTSERLWSLSEDMAGIAWREVSS